jgi:hypothetical protein
MGSKDLLPCRFFSDGGVGGFTGCGWGKGHWSVGRHGVEM